MKEIFSLKINFIEDIVPRLIIKVERYGRSRAISKHIDMSVQGWLTYNVCPLRPNQEGKRLDKLVLHNMSGNQKRRRIDACFSMLLRQSKYFYRY